MKKTTIKKIKQFFYGIIIIGLAISIIFYLSTIPSVRQTWVLATTIQPERFTELYFEDHMNLPKKAVKDESYEFRFTIHNLEYKPVNYIYEVSIKHGDNKQLLETKKITLIQNEYKTIPIYYKITEKIDRAKIVINLINKSNQQINFRIENKD